MQRIRGCWGFVMHENIANDFECCSSWFFLSRVWFLVLRLSEFSPLLHMCLLLRMGPNLS